MAPDHGVNLYMAKLNEAMDRLGRPGQTAETLKGYLENAGFLDVTVHRFKQPYGPWPREQRLKQVGAMGMMAAKS